MWKLTVGGSDFTAFVTHLSLNETASSSQDKGVITVNGAHAEVVVGAPVLLVDANGVTAWEGSISAVNAYDGSTGITVVTAANACAVGCTYGSSSNNDIATLAQGLLASTSVAWGGPSSLGVRVGGLTFDRVDSGLSVLAYLGGSTWRVQNGSCVFVSAASGIADISASLVTTNNAASAITILGGADYSTRIPLSTTVTPVGSPAGPAVHASYPQIADSGTLGVLGGSLAEMYGAGAISASATLSQTLRAGDWVQDANGIVTVAWSVQWGINAGALQVSVQFGFPALDASPVYSQSFSDAMHRYPVARLISDYVVQGADISAAGYSGVSVASAIVVLGNTLYSLSGQSLSLPSGVSYIVATSSAFAVSAQPSTVPGSTMTLWQVTVTNGVITQSLDLRPHGGAGSNNVQPNALYPVHFSGDTSGDRSVAIFNGGTKTMNHVVMSQPTQARILSDKTLLVDGTTGPVSGNLPYANHNPDLQGSFLTTGTGRVKASDSSLFNANVPNSSAFFSDFTIQYYVSGTSPNFSVALWFDNGAGGDSYIYLPNYTTTPGDRDINIGHTTQASPNKTLTGIATNQTIFVLAYYIPGSGVTFTAQTSAFTASQVRAAVQDGGYVAAYATVGTGATFTVTAAGGGHTGGNGGKIPNTY